MTGGVHCTSGAATRPSDRRLVGVDALRGLAALAVVAIHIPHDAPGGWRQHPFFFPAFLFDYGYLGVSLFVVISGFCIHRSAALRLARDSRSRLDWVRFWKRRFWRLYPPYVAAIGFSLLFAAVLHDRFSLRPNALGQDLGVHLLLVQNLTRDYATSLGNGAFWSLGMEEQLYLLYFLLFLLFVRWSRSWAVAFVAVVAVGWRLALFWLPGEGVSVGPLTLGTWYMWPFSYWLHWTLGAVAADAQAGNVRLPGWCSSFHWAAGLTGLGVLLNKNVFRLLARSQTFQPTAERFAFDGGGSEVQADVHFLAELVFAVAFFCLLNWAVRSAFPGKLRGAAARWLAGVGRFSYSLYLTHVPVVCVLERYAPFGDTPGAWLGRYLVYTPVTLAVGLAFYWAVERWFLSAEASRTVAEPCLAAIPVVGVEPAVSPVSSD